MSDSNGKYEWGDVSEDAGEAFHEEGYVKVAMLSSDGLTRACHNLTPYGARKLAIELMRLASEAEADAAL